MSKNYEIEKEGQIEFFKNYNIPYNEDNTILIDNTNGVYNGNILEFKLNINNLNKVLFQVIKYLSKMRIKGESIPIYTCLSNQNKCLSFKGIDKIFYKNELCFDNNTLALKDLNKYNLDKQEKELINLWYKIIKQAKTTKNYNKSFTYGVYQIEKELNTYIENGQEKNKKRIYDYQILNGDLITLKTLLKEYYKTHITNKMFEYELMK